MDFSILNLDTSIASNRDMGKNVNNRTANNADSDETALDKVLLIFFLFRHKMYVVGN